MSSPRARATTARQSPGQRARPVSRPRSSCRRTRRWRRSMRPATTGRTSSSSERASTSRWRRRRSSSSRPARPSSTPSRIQRVIAGQGTLGLELVEQLPGPGTVVIPIGGGGLASGIAIALRALEPELAHRRRAGREHLPVRGRRPSTGTRSPTGSRSSSRATLTSRDPRRAARRGRHRQRRADQPRDRAAARADEAPRRRCRCRTGRRAARRQIPGDDEACALLSGGNIDPTLLIQVMRHGLTEAGRFLVVRTRHRRPPGRADQLVCSSSPRSGRTSSRWSTTAREWSSDVPDRGRADARDARRGPLRRPPIGTCRAGLPRGTPAVTRAARPCTRSHRGHVQTLWQERREPGCRLLRRLRRARSSDGAGAGGAEGRDGPLRRPRRLHVARRAARSGGRARAALAVPRAAAGGARAASAARSRSSSATRWWRSSGRRWRTRTTPSGRCGRRWRSGTWRSQRADQADLHVRIAVNTGEALVALDARPAEGEGMVAGDVMNTAARLQSAAPVDGILVGEQTYRATRPARSITGRREPVAGEGQGGADRGLARRSRRRVALRGRRRAAHVARRSSGATASCDAPPRRARARPGTSRRRSS